MQILFEKSEESSGPGLGLLNGVVLKLPDSVKTPHMGWNTIKILKQNPLLEGVKGDWYFYFVHSYYACPVNNDLIVAETNYGVTFGSVIAKRNILSTQFHPEKSGKPGSIVLKNFARIVKR